MKHLVYLLSIVSILATTACHKDNAAVVPDSKTTATLPGKWYVVGNMISSGGPMYFVPANGKDYVVFNNDGTLSGTAFPTFSYYTVKDTVSLNMTNADHVTYENYLYKISHDTLTLGLAGPINCIEGCAVVLVKD
jgi:hypothetical protein